MERSSTACVPYTACNKTQWKILRKAKMMFILNQTDFSNSYSFPYRYNSCMLSHANCKTCMPKWSQQRHLCATLRTRDQVHIHLPGVLLNAGDAQIFKHLFCNVLGIQELLWLTFFLTILFTASFINLRQSSHWHGRECSG